MLVPVLADGITIKIGEYVWTFGLNVIVYLIIALVVGLFAEFIVRYRLPFGFVGAIIASLIGIWFMTQVIVISGVGDFFLYGIPIFRALIGAVIVALIWRLITFGIARRRYRTRTI